MKHTIHSLSHPLKTAFLERVQSLDSLKNYHSLISEYILEAEHQDGIYFWDNFEDASEIFEDFERSMGFLLTKEKYQNI